MAHGDLEEEKPRLWGLAASDLDATLPIHTITEETAVFD